jgi:transcriptional regulator with XRE-family HTH domain
VKKKGEREMKATQKTLSELMQRGIKEKHGTEDWETILLEDVALRRKALHLSQRDLAYWAGVSRGCVARVEQTQAEQNRTIWLIQPTGAQIQKIAYALDVLEHEANRKGGKAKSHQVDPAGSNAKTGDQEQDCRNEQ